jgi:hypothetical protein
MTSAPKYTHFLDTHIHTDYIPIKINTQMCISDTHIYNYGTGHHSHSSDITGDLIALLLHDHFSNKAHLKSRKSTKNAEFV